MCSVKPELKNNSITFFFVRFNFLKMLSLLGKLAKSEFKWGRNERNKTYFSQYFKHGLLQAVEPVLVCLVGKLKSQLFNLSLILYKNQEMIFTSEQVLKKQPCLVSVSLKGTDYLKAIIIKEIITCYKTSLLI